MEITTEGDFSAADDRTKRVTLRSHGADSSGSAMGVCPTLETSKEDSSMKTGLDSETRSG